VKKGEAPRSTTGARPAGEGASVIEHVDQTIVSAVRSAGPSARLRSVTLCGAAPAALIDVLRATLAARESRTVDVTHTVDDGPLRVTVIELERA